MAKGSRGVRSAVLACVLAAAALGLNAAAALAAPWWMPWGRHGAHGYDPNTVVTLEATVRTANPVPPMPAIEVETGVGEAVRVVLGPPWYLDRAGVRFAAGDRVIVEGSKLMEDSGRVVVIAARVRRVADGATLRLRDEQGLPLWGHMGGGPRR